MHTVRGKEITMMFGVPSIFAAMALCSVRPTIKPPKPTATGPTIEPAKPTFTGSAGPTTQVYAAVTNIPPAGLAWPPKPPYDDTVKELGNKTSFGACRAACYTYRNKAVSPVSGWVTCKTFTFLSETGQCVAVVDAGWWSPVHQPGATTGRVTWPPRPCTADADCSYNGRCTATSPSGAAGAAGARPGGGMNCVCSNAWVGDRCQTLRLTAASKHAGYRAVDGGRNTSSWGGGVLWDSKTQLFHMWAAEMLDHCGINSWTTNSHVIHATSPSLDAPFVKREGVWPAFSHEPNVAVAPTGEYVMYFTASNPGTPAPKQCTTCTDGNTPPTCPGGAAGFGQLIFSLSLSLSLSLSPSSLPPSLPTHPPLSLSLLSLLSLSLSLFLSRVSAYLPVMWLRAGFIYWQSGLLVTGTCRLPWSRAVVGMDACAFETAR